MYDEDQIRGELLSSSAIENIGTNLNSLIINYNHGVAVQLYKTITGWQTTKYTGLRDRTSDLLLDILRHDHFASAKLPADNELQLRQKIFTSENSTPSTNEPNFERKIPLTKDNLKKSNVIDFDWYNTKWKAIVITTNEKLGIYISNEEVKNNDLEYERNVQVYAAVGDTTDKKSSTGVKFKKSWRNKTDDNTFGMPDILRDVNQFYKMNVDDLFSNQCAFVKDGTLTITLVMSAIQDPRTTLSKQLMKRIAAQYEQLVHASRELRQAEQEEESRRFRIWNVQRTEDLEEEKTMLNQALSAQVEAGKRIQSEYNELKETLEKTQQELQRVHRKKATMRVQQLTEPNIRPREEDTEEQARKRIKPEENQGPALDQILLRNT